MSRKAIASTGWDHKLETVNVVVVVALAVVVVVVVLVALTVVVVCTAFRADLQTRNDRNADTPYIDTTRDDKNV